MTTARRAAYEAYINSPAWKQKRREAFLFYGRRCNRCAGYGNEVHHCCYDRFGAEEMEDLEILCTSCHKKHHHRRTFLTPKALYAKLTKKQKADLCAELECKVETLYLLLLKRDKAVTATVKNLLGIRSGKKSRKKIERRKKRRV